MFVRVAFHKSVQMPQQCMCKVGIKVCVPQNNFNMQKLVDGSSAGATTSSIYKGTMKLSGITPQLSVVGNFVFPSLQECEWDRYSK